jgi:hypothetical protein
VLIKVPKRRRVLQTVVGILVALVLAWLPCQAVIFISTADPSHNTTPPAGALADSGWQWQGQWHGKLGTPIGTRHFIAAAHIGGSVGSPFVLNGVTHTTVARFDDPETDLVIWEVDTAFPSYAPLYSDSDELGKPLVVFGGGTGRGDEVRLPVGEGELLRGWRWGGPGRLRWGQNVVAKVSSGGLGRGDLLRATFDAAGGENEAHLGANDSSGAVFIKEDGTWKLAGINYAVEGLFAYQAGVEPFNAALFDSGGLWVGQGTNWTLRPNLGGDLPSSFYATRISARLAWIRSIVPEPADPPAESLGDVPALPAWGLAMASFAILSSWIVRSSRKHISHTVFGPSGSLTQT